MRTAKIGVALLLAAVPLVACAPSGEVGTLRPTLSVSHDADRLLAVQNGIPVPDFGWQPRPRIDLDGAWRVEEVGLDPAVTMTDRDDSLEVIQARAESRHLPEFDDAAWGSVEVPGSFNPPPAGEEGGAWYRRTFDVPESWTGRAVTLRFGSANYVADAWLNGIWLGYHEGGYTPFAFDVGGSLRPGEENVLAVRVHAIPLGTRTDVIPWGLVDWWNYGGLTGSVWLEAAPPTHIVRADVVTHLDAVDVSVLLYAAARRAGIAEGTDEEGSPRGQARLQASIRPATVDEANLLDPDPSALVSGPGIPLAVAGEEVVLPEPGEAVGARIRFEFADADAWSPAVPALYVLHVELVRDEDAPREALEARPADSFWTTFGIRHVAVDPIQPRVLLNGEPAFFRGVGLHRETLTWDADGMLTHGTPAQNPEIVLTELNDARRVGANLLRTGHTPGDPTMLMLADRLGFAVWEEIPLYHATPLTFSRTLERGIAQQMLREMALRDMNHPSVLFHGLANESTGEAERTDALAELHEVDREIDGTRLTGQAAYGWQPTDPTHAPLDVAGFTFYYGVFYGSEPGPDTRRALRQAHATHPEKPILALEFGRWADRPFDEERQRMILEETYPAFEEARGDEPNGFVGAATWWTLHDFATQIPGIVVEDFGLVRPDGTLRPAGTAAAASFVAPAGLGAALNLEPDLERARPAPPAGIGDWALAGYLAYALGVSVAFIGGATLLLTHRGGRATGRRRA